VNVGQTPTCQKKDGVTQANFNWFEDVEAYCHCSMADGAASMPKPTIKIFSLHSGLGNATGVGRIK